jgi:hypothetical protein
MADNPQKQACFVIMPFGSPFDRYYQNIFAPAVRDAGLEPKRADSLFRPSPIMADIWKFVREAAVLVADVSGKNPNVFYELGLAHAIGKPVIIVATTLDDVPFDLRGLRVLIYEKENENWGAELRAVMQASLEETLRDVVSAVPQMFLGKPKVELPSEDPLRHELRRLSEEVSALRKEQVSRPITDAVRGPGQDDRIYIVSAPEEHAESIHDLFHADGRPVRTDSAAGIVRFKFFARVNSTFLRKLLLMHGTRLEDVAPEN